MPCQGWPAREAGLPRDRGLCIGQTILRLADLGIAQSPSGGKMLTEYRNRFLVAFLQGGEQRLRLSAQVIQVRTGWELLGHARFSMHFARGPQSGGTKNVRCWV